MDIITQLQNHKDAKDLDLSSVLYIVNNQQRASQLQMQIAGEMAEKGIKAILPPDIVAYQVGFLQLAGNIVKGSASGEGLTEYSEEKQQLLMFQIAVETIQSTAAGDAYNTTANNRHHLVKDTKSFLKDVITHMKWDAAAQHQAEKGSPSELFCQFFRNYMDRAGSCKGSRFFDIFIAYRELYEYLKSGEKFEFDKTIVVEDFDDMEPIFREICVMLEKSGVKVEKTVSSPAGRAGTAKHRWFYNYMTPLDEAESIGFKVKEMLASGVKPHDISVVYYNRDIFDVLQLVFDRFGISYFAMEPLKDSPVYDAFRSAVSMAYGEFDPREAVDLLSCEASEFNTTGFTASMFVNALSDLGYKVRKEPVESVKKALAVTVAKREEFVKNSAGKYDEKFINRINDDAASLKAFSDFLDKAPSMDLAAIFDASVASPGAKHASVYARLASVIAGMDAILAPYRAKGKDSHDFRFMLEALFEVLGCGEYMEFIDPVKEKLMFKEPQVEKEPSAAFISMLPPMLACNTSANTVFMCGMDASMDKREAVSYPAALAQALGLPLWDRLRMKKNAKLVQAAQNPGEVHFSYSYLDFGSKVLGISNAARLISKMDGVKTVSNSDNSLLRGYDIISTGRNAPDDSYRFGPVQGASEMVKAKTVKGVPKIKELLDNSTALPMVRVTQLADFAVCPRRLVNSLLAGAAGLTEADMTLRMSGKTGNFWHRVFELAAKEKKLFNSVKQADIEKALKTGIKGALAEFDPEVIQEKSGKEFLLEAEKAVIPLFAGNEAARKKTMKGLSSVEQEIKLGKECGTFCIEGTTDRLDVYGNTAVLWDYKTGNRQKTSFSFFAGKSKFTQANYSGDKRRFDSGNGRDAVQLGIYTYLLSNEKTSELKMYKTMDKAAGVIYMDGSDNLDDIETVKLQAAQLPELVEKVIAAFAEFIEQPADILEQPGMNDSGFTRGIQPCSYCEYAKNCEMLLMKGGMK
ncbi:MAG: PD-(D/E)XK nuclease family protein [Spirochaetia bacterium]|nr:PD-(D/E)XK nuclease family protein [Spirochaetia bacterium]